MISANLRDNNKTTSECPTNSLGMFLSKMDHTGKNIEPKDSNFTYENNITVMLKS